jgi:hypothetical protein
MKMVTIECRWGGPAAGACWNIGACGCCPTVVEEVWREAHDEQLRRLARGMFDDITDALRLPQFVAWLSRRLA